METEEAYPPGHMRLYRRLIVDGLPYPLTGGDGYHVEDYFKKWFKLIGSREGFLRLLHGILPTFWESKEWLTRLITSMVTVDTVATLAILGEAAGRGVLPWWGALSLAGLNTAVLVFLEHNYVTRVFENGRDVDSPLAPWLMRAFDFSLTISRLWPAITLLSQATSRSEMAALSVYSLFTVATMFLRYHSIETIRELMGEIPEVCSG